MVKCEVLHDCVIAVGKGSIVEVSERQFELAKKYLKPLNKKAKDEALVEPKKEAVETTELPKTKKVRKK